MIEIAYLKRTPDLPYVRTDAGRGTFPLREAKDCTVRAFAIAVGVTYAEAHRELARLGRKCGRGMKFAVVAYKRPDLFIRTVLKRGERKRVGTLVRTLRTGRHVVRVNRHVFALVNGVVHDLTSFESLKNCIVTDIYTVKPLTPDAQCATLPQ